MSIVEYLLVLEADNKNYERQYPIWAKHGVLLCRATTMHQAIDLLPMREYVAIGINADCINYTPLVGILRESTALPIHIVKSQYNVKEHIRALSLGADVFGVWAKDPEENVKRGLALFHRHHGRLNHTNRMSSVLTQGDIRIYLDHHRIFVGEQEIHPRDKEYRLLLLFMENSGRVLAPEWLISTTQYRSCCGIAMEKQKSRLGGALAHLACSECRYS